MPARIALPLLLVLLVGCDEELRRDVDGVIAALKAGMWAQVPVMLTDRAIGDLALEPSEARRLLEALTEQLGRMKSDKNAALTLAKRVRLLAEKTREADPQVADALLCLSDAHLFLARLAHRLGEEGDAKDWDEAVALLERLHAAEPGEGEHAARAARVLIEAARGDANRRKDYVGRAVKITDEARVRHALSIPVTAASAECRVEMAKLVADADPKAAKAHLEDALAELAQGMTPQNPDPAIATAHAEAVGATRQLPKLKVKAEYRMVSHVSGENYLRFRIPLSSYWFFSRERGHELGTVYRLHPDGRTVRLIGLSRYRWDRMYGDVGGDNIKGLARAQQAGSIGALREVRSQRDLVKGRLNRKITSSYFYEVVGVDKDGDSVHFRHYFFKSKKRMLTFSVFIYEVGEPGDVEPAMEEIVGSIEEVD